MRAVRQRGTKSQVRDTQVGVLLSKKRVGERKPYSLSITKGSWRAGRQLIISALNTNHVGGSQVTSLRLLGDLSFSLPLDERGI